MFSYNDHANNPIIIVYDIIIFCIFQAADDAALISMVKNVLDTPHHYFSLNYDLTHSMQRLAFIAPEFRQVSLKLYLSVCPL